MSCCTGGGLAGARAADAPTEKVPAIDLMVPDVRCAACIASIEGALKKLPDVASARLNLSTRRLAITFDGLGDAGRAMAAVEALGYGCRPFDATAAGAAMDDEAGRELLRCLAIAGFAAANVMLLSVSVWSGAEGVTRDLFHWISALIALPAVAIAGRPFFRSALSALSHWRLNMDVPISLAVILAAAMSLKVSIQGGDGAFFDAAVMLLFFLLVGRYLDHRVRARARNAATRLLSLWASKTTRIGPDGPEETRVEDVAIGDRVIVEAGARTPVDGVIESGLAELDVSALTGESAPLVVRPGDEAHAGALALTGPIVMRATAVNADSYLARAIQLMESVESGRTRYVQIADKAAKIYAPAVHLVALLAFLLQMYLTGGDWSYALWVAVSVLIITCPCALGLAVPAVHTVANGALFRRGVLVKDGAALERLAEADRVVFDKTGTLTLGRPRVVASGLKPDTLALSGALARMSRHPLAAALARFADAPDLKVEDAEETPGGGIAGRVGPHKVRIGSAGFVGVDAGTGGGTEVWVAVDGAAPARVTFADALRPGAADVVSDFAQKGFAPALLSGDREAAVAETAAALGLQDWRAGQSPLAKIEHLESLKAAGYRPLMVGDGVNDGPALAAAHVSMAPASASDVGRAAADFVLLGDDLSAVGFAHRVARRAKVIVLQNFALAATYNLISVPIAVAGFASPLAAAIAMSTSSILVTANALRLAREGRRAAPAPAPAEKEALA